ncbi:MAG: hypothetical protein JJU11_18340 [Candidatus Sumerlaeia bacterium]|nr:hypothetical protein [Candidatus Sumerlaeia bacterium]
MGHEVYYLEDTCECNYDPEQESISEDPSHALRYTHEILSAFGLGEHWCHVDHTGRHHGISEEKFRRICADADLFIVLSGGCWVWREHYLGIPRRVFIDSDPAFTQIALDRARAGAATNPSQKWYVEFFGNYTHHFTFGANIGTPQCDIPTGDINWIHTWQPVSTNLWRPSCTPLPSRSVYTTLMTWKIGSFEDIGGNKDIEFLKILNLADKCSSDHIQLEIAVNGPREFLSKHGWRCLDAMAISGDPWRYHQYITSSSGEFSVAKHTYVATNSGWFSDRTICYLASGKPAVVQETGFGHHLPVGEGLLSWTTVEEAHHALMEISTHPHKHQNAAREIAMEYFRDEIVLRRMLDQIQA